MTTYVLVRPFHPLTRALDVVRLTLKETAMLFAALILISFALWLAAAIPSWRVPEWLPRAFFLACAVLWALPRVTG